MWLVKKNVYKTEDRWADLLRDCVVAAMAQWKTSLVSIKCLDFLTVVRNYVDVDYYIVTSWQPGR